MSTSVTSVESPLMVNELQSLLGRAEPAALLVAPRILRRIVKEDCHVEGLSLQVPHRKSYALRRERLLAIATKEELGLSADAVLPDQLLLLTSPDPARLSSRPRDVALVKYWRLLFHVSVDRHFHNLQQSGQLNAQNVQGYLQRLGRGEFSEARQVLHHEKFLLPPETDLRVFCEFLAVYLELRWFNRPLLAYYFPAFATFDEVDRVATELIDAEALFHATRLIGAPDPATIFVFLDHDNEEEAEPVQPPTPPQPRPSLLRYTQFARLAAIASERGNNARAAILHTRAQHAASTPEELQRARQAALAEIDRLTARLASALELHHHEAEEWRHRLPAVLDSAARGLFPAGARFLFDLQKVCIDHERDLFAVDLVEATVSLFRRPIQRPLPQQREVLLVKHLRAAVQRLSKIRMEDDQRRKLSILMHAALHHREKLVRERFRPLLAQAFDEVALLPANYPERLARRKLIEELLDRVIERGFLTIGDLRDAISRNQLKLGDLSGPREFFSGDAILKLNSLLAEKLDGVYRRGEVYMRLLQRGSALAFGTVLGRWLTLYLVLPLAAAFGTITCCKEFWYLGHLAFEWTEYLLEVMTGENVLSPNQEVEYQLGMAGGGLTAVGPVPHSGVTMADLAWTAVLALFFLGVLASPRFRQRVLRVLSRVWQALVFTINEGPAWVMNLPPVQRVLNSPPMLAFRRYALRPVLLTMAVAVFCSLTRLSTGRQLILDGTVLFLGLIAFNTGLWRLIEETSIDWFARNWHWLRTELLPGTLRLIVWMFKEALDFVERLLYTVDEWLRFRSGQSNKVFYSKAILGLIWFLATYLIRVVINLFVEPTFNPIKHFPVVTVAAKLIIPIIPLLYVAITSVVNPILGEWLGGLLATTIILLFPGIFGFIAWEFKENWKLYRANRSKRLERVMIGHHGERMVQFFRPGFHSGTVYKLYNKLRRAARNENGGSFHKQREQLLHVEEAIRHFVEREFLMVLEESKGWNGLRIHLGTLLLATNRVEIELCHPDPRADSLWLAFEQREGWLLARITRSGWLARLTAEQRLAFHNALAGLYKLAGVELIDEQLRATLPAEFQAYDILPTRLLAWSAPAYTQAQSFPLEQPGLDLDGLPVALAIPLDKLLYSHASLRWDAWVEAWESDQTGKSPTTPLLPQFRFLPLA